MGMEVIHPLWFELTEALSASSLMTITQYCPVSLSQPMIQEALPHLPSENGKVRTTTPNYTPDVETAEAESKSTLIEFPGTNRTLPEWRKQLSQRVREVQERKAR